MKFEILKALNAALLPASALLTLGSSLLVPATTFAAASPSSDASPVVRPTIVLVHGAFAESSSWNGVASRLIAQGYPVIAAAVPLRGLQSDANYVAALFKSIRGPIV